MNCLNKTADLLQGYSIDQGLFETAGTAENAAYAKSVFPYSWQG